MIDQKHVLIDESDNKLVVVRGDGIVALDVFAAGSDQPEVRIQLSRADARTLGLIIQHLAAE